jgi:O-acetylhomoserine (thiol)-lyase
VHQRNTGSVLSPLAAFLLLQGTETLAVRMERHLANTNKVASYLANHPGVDWCHYLGFADDPCHTLAKKYLGGHGAPFLTFGVSGGFEAGKRFYDALKLFKRLVNIGDAKSLACHPASTTHRQLTPEELARVGVKPEMIRLAIGIEHSDDIIADLAQALDAAQEIPATHAGGGEPAASSASNSVSSTICPTAHSNAPNGNSSIFWAPRRRTCSCG